MARPCQNPRYGRGNLSRDKFGAAPRRFVIEQNAVESIQSIRFTIISCQLEASDFADSVRGPWMKSSIFALRHFLGAPKHLARACEIKFAIRRGLADGAQHVMGAVNVDVHRGEFIFKRVTHETLSCQVIALVGLNLPQNLKKPWKTLERSRMQVNFANDMANPT